MQDKKKCGVCRKIIPSCQNCKAEAPELFCHGHPKSEEKKCEKGCENGKHFDPDCPDVPDDCSCQPKKVEVEDSLYESRCPECPTEKMDAFTPEFCDKHAKSKVEDWEKEFDEAAKGSRFHIDTTHFTHESIVKEIKSFIRQVAKQSYEKGYADGRKGE